MDYLSPQHLDDEICRSISPALRRVPEQHRSWANVDHILYAAQEMLLDARFDDVQQSAPSVCDKAGVPIGTFYTYFENTEAVLEALRLLWIHNFHQIIDDMFAVPPQTWQDIALRIVETGVASFTSPIVRELYISHTTTATARAAELGANAYLGTHIRRSVEALGYHFLGDQLDELMLVEISDRLCRVAFADAGNEGDRLGATSEDRTRYIERTKKIVLTVLGSLIAATPQPDRLTTSTSPHQEND